MDLHELPFAKIIVLRQDIAEIIVNEGVEMNAEMVQEYHEFLLSHLKPKFSLLINKVNSYTYDFDAQRNLATLEEINVMAAVTYNRISRTATEWLASFPRDVAWNIEMFSDREKALSWLLAEQKRLNRTS